jgi:hypothetical protein
MASPQQVRSALVAAAAAAVVGGSLLGLVGWVQTLPALVLGVLVGSAAFLGSQRHRDPAIQAIAAGMALLGVIVAVVVEAALSAGGGASHTFGMLVAVSYWEIVWPALAAIIGAIVRLQL